MGEVFDCDTCTDVPEVGFEAVEVEDAAEKVNDVDDVEALHLENLDWSSPVLVLIRIVVSCGRSELAELHFEKQWGTASAYIDASNEYDDVDVGGAMAHRWSLGSDAVGQAGKYFGVADSAAFL